MTAVRTSDVAAYSMILLLRYGTVVKSGNKEFVM
jgi:hypothetical protein